MPLFFTLKSTQYIRLLNNAPRAYYLVCYANVFTLPEYLNKTFAGIMGYVLATKGILYGK
jgi:hypothetical protein